MPPVEPTTATTVRASEVVVAVVMAAVAVETVAVETVAVVAVAVVAVAMVSQAALMVLLLLMPVQKGSLKTPPNHYWRPKNLIARPVSAPKKIWTLKRPRSQKMSLIPVSTTKKIRTLKNSRSCQLSKDESFLQGGLDYLTAAYMIEYLEKHPDLRAVLDAVMGTEVDAEMLESNFVVKGLSSALIILHQLAFQGHKKMKDCRKTMTYQEIMDSK
jgi:hypothetical protein